MCAVKHLFRLSSALLPRQENLQKPPPSGKQRIQMVIFLHNPEWSVLDLPADIGKTIDAQSAGPAVAAGFSALTQGCLTPDGDAAFTGRSSNP